VKDGNNINRSERGGIKINENGNKEELPKKLQQHVNGVQGGDSVPGKLFNGKRAR